MARPGSASWVAAILLGLATLDPAPAPAQTEIFGLKLSGEAEVGGRIFLERPSKSESGKFEEYRDIPPGIFLEDLRLRLESKDESYALELRAKEAGEDDQNFLLRSLKLGRYEFEFEWDQIPHVFSRTGRSPYTETSRGVFELPDSIQTRLQGASAAERPDILRDFLATQARDIDLETRWDIARFLFKLTPTPDWDLRAEYTRTRKTGERPIGTTFVFTNQVELPEPIDQTVHDLRLSAELAREWWQLQFSYNFSLFKNDVDVLVWDNPLRVTDHATLGPARGRLDLVPDNVAHTLGVTGAVNLPLRSRLTGTVSYGMRFQDDNFIPHTINSAISHPGLALPADSLDGDVRTSLANFQLTSRPFSDISLTARYRYYDFDNRTPVLTFPARVRTDQTLIVGPIHNHQYSYAKQNAGADVGWRLWGPASLKVGHAWEQWRRDPKEREVGETNEHTPKISLDVTPLDWLLLRTSYARSWRKGSRYAQVVDAQFPLLRKYDLADRDRDRVDVLAQLSPLDTLTFTATYSLRNDDYEKSPFGLQDDKSWAAGFDITWNPTEWLGLFASYMRETFDARQRSKYREPPAQLDNPTFDWVAENDDLVDTFGLGVDAALIPNKLDFRLAWNYSQATGKMRAFNPVTPAGGTAAQNASATAVDFPDIKDSLHQLEASLRYRFNRGWFARARYVFEKFDVSDFRTDDIQPFMGAVDASTGTGIFLGAQVRDYTAHIVSFTVGYRF